MQMADGGLATGSPLSAEPSPPAPQTPESEISVASTPAASEEPVAEIVEGDETVVEVPPDFNPLDALIPNISCAYSSASNFLTMSESLNALKASVQEKATASASASKSVDEIFELLGAMYPKEVAPKTGQSANESTQIQPEPELKSEAKTSEIVDEASAPLPLKEAEKEPVEDSGKDSIVEKSDETSTPMDAPTAPTTVASDAKDPEGVESSASDASGVHPATDAAAAVEVKKPLFWKKPLAIVAESVQKKQEKDAQREEERKRREAEEAKKKKEKEATEAKKAQAAAAAAEKKASVAADAKVSTSSTTKEETQKDADAEDTSVKAPAFAPPPTVYPSSGFSYASILRGAPAPVTPLHAVLLSNKPVSETKKAEKEATTATAAKKESKKESKKEPKKAKNSAAAAPEPEVQSKEPAIASAAEPEKREEDVPIKPQPAVLIKDSTKIALPKSTLSGTGKAWAVKGVLANVLAQEREKLVEEQPIEVEEKKKADLTPAFGTGVNKKATKKEKTKAKVEKEPLMESHKGKAKKKQDKKAEVPNAPAPQALPATAPAADTNQPKKKNNKKKDKAEAKAIADTTKAKPVEQQVELEEAPVEPNVSITCFFAEPIPEYSIVSAREEVRALRQRIVASASDFTHSTVVQQALSELNKVDASSIASESLANLTSALQTCASSATLSHENLPAAFNIPNEESKQEAPLGLRSFALHFIPDALETALSRAVAVVAQQTNLACGNAMSNKTLTPISTVDYLRLAQFVQENAYANRFSSSVAGHKSGKSKDRKKQAVTYDTLRIPLPSITSLPVRLLEPASDTASATSGSSPVAALAKVLHQQLFLQSCLRCLSRDVFLLHPEIANTALRGISLALLQPQLRVLFLAYGGATSVLSVFGAILDKLSFLLQSSDFASHIQGNFLMNVAENAEVSKGHLNIVQVYMASFYSVLQILNLLLNHAQFNASVGSDFSSLLSSITEFVLMTLAPKITDTLDLLLTNSLDCLQSVLPVLHASIALLDSLLQWNLTHPSFLKNKQSPQNADASENEETVNQFKSLLMLRQSAAKAVVLPFLVKNALQISAACLSPLRAHLQQYPPVKNSQYYVETAMGFLATYFALSKDVMLLVPDASVVLANTDAKSTIASFEAASNNGFVSFANTMEIVLLDILPLLAAKESEESWASNPVNFSAILGCDILGSEILSIILSLFNSNSEQFALLEHPSILFHLLQQFAEQFPQQSLAIKIKKAFSSIIRV